MACNASKDAEFRDPAVTDYSESRVTESTPLCQWFAGNAHHHIDILKAAAERRPAEFHILLQRLQMMKSTHLSVRLEANYAHPLNRGWTDFFLPWTSAETPRQLWSLHRGAFARDFVAFCERKIRLGPVTGVTKPMSHDALPDSLARFLLDFTDEWLDHINGLKARLVHQDNHAWRSFRALVIPRATTPIPPGKDCLSHPSSWSAARDSRMNRRVNTTISVGSAERIAKPDFADLRFAKQPKMLKHVSLVRTLRVQLPINESPRSGGTNCVRPRDVAGECSRDCKTNAVQRIRTRGLDILPKAIPPLTYRWSTNATMRPTSPPYFTCLSGAGPKHLLGRGYRPRPHRQVERDRPFASASDRTKCRPYDRDIPLSLSQFESATQIRRQCTSPNETESMRTSRLLTANLVPYGFPTANPAGGCSLRFFPPKSYESIENCKSRNSASSTCRHPIPSIAWLVGAQKLETRPNIVLRCRSFLILKGFSLLFILIMTVNAKPDGGD